MLMSGEDLAEALIKAYNSAFMADVGLCLLPFIKVTQVCMKAGNCGLFISAAQLSIEFLEQNLGVTVLNVLST